MPALVAGPPSPENAPLPDPAIVVMIPAGLMRRTRFPKGVSEFAVAKTPGPGSGEIQSVRPQLVAAHTSFFSDTCAEVSLHVWYGHRSRVVAARFELIRDRCQVSALEFA